MPSKQFAELDAIFALGEEALGTIDQEINSKLVQALSGFNNR